MSAEIYKKILEHPDRDEIISKLLIDKSPKDISTFLKDKYQALGDNSFFISESVLKKFKDNYLDIVNYLRQDIAATKNVGLVEDIDKELTKAVKQNKTYKEKLQEYLSNEIDIKATVKKLIIATEMRLDKIMEDIYNDDGGVGKKDYVAIQYINSLSMALEKLHKINTESALEKAGTTITVNIVEQHVAIIQDSIREIVTSFDQDVAFKFMDSLNKKFMQLKDPNVSLMTQSEKMDELKLIDEKMVNI